MGQALEDLVRQAEAAFSAGDAEACYELATEGLANFPDDERLLALGGRAGLEVGGPQTVDLLRRLVAVRPEDPDAWRDLGLAEVSEGDLNAANASLGAALDLDPSDEVSLVNLGHVRYMLGDVDEAIALLDRAARQAPEDPAPLRNLVDMYRGTDRLEDALRAAEALATLNGDDVLAVIDLAELRMSCGDLDGAVVAYHKLRRIDGDSGHQAYAYHGMVEVELRREGWRRALDLAIAATAVDRHQLTTDLLAFVAGQLFGEAVRPTPSREDVARRLAERRGEHRRMHAEALAQGVGR